jgi:hypothetical protein
MFSYDFKCTGPDCEHIQEVGDRHKSYKCPFCNFPLKRVWSLFHSTPIITEPVFNPSLGKFVSGKADMMEKFKVASASASERLNMDVNYQPVDLAQKGSIGVTDEGLDSTYKQAHDSKVK